MADGFCEKVSGFLASRCNLNLSEIKTCYCALSGGADSTALLLFLKKFAPDAEAIHINHNLRGAESLRDENFCKALCEKLSVNLHVISVDVKEHSKITGKSIEESARILRYKAFENITHGVKPIFTAHNADDNAETMIINLTRGTGLTGLCGIPAVRKNIYRPFLSVKRSEIIEFLNENEQDFIVDSSNFDNSYTRNFIRNEIMPLLVSINPSLSDSVFKTSEIIASLDSFVKSEAEKITDLENAPSVILREAILIFLRKNNIEPDYAKISLLENGIKSTGKAKVQFTKDSFVSFDGKYLNIIETKEKYNDNPEIYINYDENVIYGDKHIKLKRRFNKNSHDGVIIHSLLTNNYIDCAKIEGEKILRHRKNGDKFIKNGNTFHSKLKTLYNEDLSPERRSGNLVLCDSKGIIWVENFGPAARVAVSDDTEEFLEIEVKNA
ncbi:MAG: tRNA lysidine(34) synthetase TilS [Ruminococcus sp.]|jgi:tRNA(Ile)-lysidine synthase|nr:tRNA lysidine(34) synthetase TilS [Ruminococcus sp.]